MLRSVFQEDGDRVRVSIDGRIGARCEAKGMTRVVPCVWWSVDDWYNVETFREDGFLARLTVGAVDAGRVHVHVVELADAACLLETKNVT